MHKNLCILFYCCIFASEKETNNNLNPKTRKGREIMKTLTNIENQTLNDIKVELNKMYDENQYEENYGMQYADFLEMRIKFADGSMMKLIPTFWSPEGFSGFHYTFSDKQYWLDGDNDKGEIAEATADWLDNTASRIYDEMVFRGGSFASMEVIADGIEE